MLIKQGKGKIDWTDYSWNPVSGCYHNCSYCYMQRMVKRGFYSMKPAFHPERLGEVIKLKKPSKIFVCSSGDMFGEWVEKDWVEAVISIVKELPQHTFQFLTKNPNRYSEFSFPKNCWLGTTIDGLPRTINNARILTELKHKNIIRFVSFEPLLNDVHEHFTSNGNKKIFENLDWIIIGADSNKNAEKAPDVWAEELISMARESHIPVWIKDNYGYPEIIKEFPK